MNLESETLDLEFQPSRERGGQFRLHSPSLDRELRQAFLPSFRQAAAALRLTIVGDDPLVVDPPVERRWNDTELEEHVFARAGDKLFFSWSGDDTWSARWISARPGGDEVANARHDSQAEFHGRTVAAAGRPPRIDIVECQLSHAPSEPPLLRVRCRLRFVDCPLPPRSAVLVRADDEGEPGPEQEVILERDNASVTAALPVPGGEPEVVAVTVAVPGSTPPVASPPTRLRIPTALGDAEIAVDGGEYSRQLYASDVPARVRFRHTGYAPGKLTLVFRLSGGERERLEVGAVKVETTPTHACYDLEIDDAKVLLVRSCVPGELSVEVANQGTDAGAPPASAIKLVPRLVRGVWEQSASGVSLKLTSLEVNAQVIAALGSHFDPASYALEAPLLGSEGTFPAPSGVVTRVVLVGGKAIPLDDRDFVPLFPLDATELWKDSLLLQSVSGETVRLGLDEGPGQRQWWTLVERARQGETTVLSLRDGMKALLSLSRESGSRFAERIADPYALIAGNQPFGLFFRGFCWQARLEKLRPGLAEEGLLLRLATPMPVDGRDVRCEPPISAFLPRRALRSEGRRALAFWEPPAEPVTVPIEDGIPVHERVGYVYRNGAERFWARLPDEIAQLELVTFDGLAFALNGTDIDFVGWWLPTGRGVFPAAPPFHDYTFDFSEGAAAPYEYEIRGEKVIVKKAGRWLSAEASDALATRIGEARTQQPRSREAIEVAGVKIAVRWRQRDADSVLVATATKAEVSLRDRAVCPALSVAGGRHRSP